MTTVEYLNRPRRNIPLEDSDEEDEFDDYFDDEISDDFDEVNWSASSKQSNTLQSQARFMWRSARIILRRNWRLLLRKTLPGYHKYRKLTLLRRQSESILCSTTGRNSRRTSRSNGLPNKDSDLLMEELLATTTIRSTESSRLPYPSEPNYDDDMGLDMSLLDEKRTPEKRRSSKAARILDISDEEAIRYQQSMQETQRQATASLVSLHTNL